MAKEKWLVKEEELDDNQYKIRELNPKKSLVVQGCAGSGKTILALWRAKELQEEGKEYWFIVYTRALKRFIEDGVREIGINTSRIIIYEHWVNMGHPEADYIIVDESQDFTSTQILLLQEKSRVSVIYFGDSAQQLYPCKSVLKESKTIDEPTLTMTQIAELTGLPIWNLMINYRLPKTLARFAQKIPKIQDDLEAKCKKPGNALPIITKQNSFDEELDGIVEVLEMAQLTDVAIILPKNTDVEKAYVYLKSKNITVEVKYLIKGAPEIFSLDFNSTNVKVLTYHSSKGLQFETVFIPACEVKSEFYRNPLYVAATRPYKDLIISHTAPLSPFLKSISHKLYEEKSLSIYFSNDLPF